MTAVPYQKPGAPESFGLTPDECRSAAWAVTPDGNHHRGAAAANQALSVALGNRLPYRLYGLPVLQQAEDFAYDWVARNRYRFPSDTPYCRQYPEECGGRGGN